MNFSDFGFADEVLDAIHYINYETPTPIQEQAIPAIMDGKDVLGSAQTGTGKTAAFLLPILDKIVNSKIEDKIQALVIVPTRELAVQITQQVEGFSYFTPISSIAVYGGGDGGLFTQEKQALTKGVELVVGTPGRLIAHLNMTYVDTSHLSTLILDEADRMLDMGFHDDLMKIISKLPKERQNLLFSATMPPKIRDLARKIMNPNPQEINIAISKPAEKVTQLAFVIYENQKIPLLKYILSTSKYKSVIIFCSTKLSVKTLTAELKSHKLTVGQIHSDLEQKERGEILLQFKNRNLPILVATDIIARGIDIEDIDVVINYDVPSDGEDYIHRIGRTARAASDGMAITLINEADQSKFARIEKLIEKEVEKSMVPPGIGDTPEYNPRTPRTSGKRRYYGKKSGSKNYSKSGKGKHFSGKKKDASKKS